MCMYTFSVAVLKLPVQRVRNSCTNTASLSACLLILSSGDTHLPRCSSKLNAHCCRNEQVEAEPRGEPAGCAAARGGAPATLVMAVRLRAAFGGMPGDVQMLHGFAGLWAGRCAPRCTCACACAGWVHLPMSPPRCQVRHVHSSAYSSVPVPSTPLSAPSCVRLLCPPGPEDGQTRHVPRAMVSPCSCGAGLRLQAVRGAGRPTAVCGPAAQRHLAGPAVGGLRH